MTSAALSAGVSLIGEVQNVSPLGESFTRTRVLAARERLSNGWEEVRFAEIRYTL